MQQEQAVPRTERLLRKVPEITVYFWIVKLLSTAMGESTSDFFVYHINPYVAVVLGFVGLIGSLILQLVVRRYVTWIYWTTVVMVAVFGTMAADVTHVVLGVPYVASSTVFAIVLALVFVVWHRVERTLSIHTVTAGRRELFYWATIISTFALGTAAGDMTAASFHLGYLVSIIVFAALFIAPGIGYFLFGLNEVVAFWLAYVVTRPLGASVADWLGKPFLGGLGLGDGKIALGLTILIAGMLAFLTVTRKEIPRATPS